MKLDSRILKGKKPLDCFDEDIAKQFIGKKGYVTDFLQDFCNLNKVKVSELKTVLHTELCCYLCGSVGKKYFLPCEWVKEPEKKYRPYSLEEFFKIFKVGDLIVFRMKIFDEIKCAMFTGYITDGYRIDDKTPGACEVTLGSCRYSLFSLFENFELYNGCNGEWLPFGVIDEDKE